MSVQSKVIKINTDLFTTKNKTPKNHSNKNIKLLFLLITLKKNLLTELKNIKTKKTRKKTFLILLTIIINLLLMSSMILLIICKI